MNLNYADHVILYHKRILEIFKSNDKMWAFFSNPKKRTNDIIEYKQELLKNTYKYTKETHAVLYANIVKIQQKIGLQNLNITAFQSQGFENANAGIVVFENECFLIFSGNIIDIMSPEELETVIAHELAHCLFYKLENGQMEIADTIINAIGNNFNSEPVYLETARRFKLYTEIFCDRIALEVSSNQNAMVSGLLKITTHTQNLDVSEYLKQIDEILTLEPNSKTNQNTHPEIYIRAKAINLWYKKEEKASEIIDKLVDNHPHLDKLDLLQQKRLNELTFVIIHLLLKPNWMKTTLTLSHAKQFKSDFVQDKSAVINQELIEQVLSWHDSVHEYLCYVLFDFCKVDSVIEIPAIGWCLQFSEDLQMKDIFKKIITRELKLSAKRLDKFILEALNQFNEIKEGNDEQVYE